MAVAVIVDIPGGNQQVYEQLTGKLFQDGKLPEGWQIHLAGPTASGWRIINVVPSQEQFEAFAREELVAKMLAAHADRGNLYSLWAAATAAFSAR